MLLFEYPDIFGICLIKQKCCVFSKYRFYQLWPNPISADFKILHISLKIHTKRIGTIKKMCVFTLQETFVLSSICQKCQGTPIKAFLSFVIKEKYTKRGGSLYSPFNSKRKNVLSIICKKYQGSLNFETYLPPLLRELWESFWVSLFFSITFFS